MLVLRMAGCSQTPTSSHPIHLKFQHPSKLGIFTSPRRIFQIPSHTFDFKGLTIIKTENWLRWLYLFQKWKFANCTAEHSAYCKDCSFKTGNEIQGVKVVRSMSFPDARKSVEATIAGLSGKSLADAPRISLFSLWNTHYNY